VFSTKHLLGVIRIDIIIISGNTGFRRGEMFTIEKLNHVFRVATKHSERIFVRCSSNLGSCSLTAVCGSNKFVYVLEGCAIKVNTWFLTANAPVAY
jgi:hypothetical protein